MNEYTTYLYARSSFIEGIARILDFGNTLQVYNTSRRSDDPDAWALATDWHAIGEDMKRAVHEIQATIQVASAHEQTESQSAAE